MQVKWEHVKGHSGDPGNDKAEEHADEGKKGKVEMWEAPRELMAEGEG